MTRVAGRPLVSVLVPVYNHAAYITRCLESVVADGYPCLELLIIDDGSRDDSSERAREWYAAAGTSALHRFELVRRPNKGVTKTLNELVAMARGEYVVLLASDDYLLPGGIEARMSYLLAHPAKLAVFGDCIVVDDRGDTTYDSGIADLYGGHVTCLTNERLLPLEIIYNWCVPGPGFMARRELYERVGLYDESLTVEDWDMYLRIAAQGALGFIPAPVAAYRYHGGNSVRSETMRMGQLDSLMRTAWKNNGRFKGILRLGLLYKFFKLKQDTAVVLGFTARGYLYRRVSKLLYRISVLRYQRIVESLPS